jgi:hypothetical protein
MTKASDISNEQESTMANNKADHVGQSDDDQKQLKTHVKEEAVLSSVAIHQANEKEPITAAPRSLSPTAPKTFPCTLMEMINWCGESEQADEDGISSLLCWGPDGKYFTINDQEKLSKHVLKRFFKDSKFDSFLRKLYRWGFKQVPLKRDNSCRRQRNLSFFVDGFERDDSSSCTKLKVRYSQKEGEARTQKSLKAKLKKMQQKSNEKHNIGWRKGKPEQERTPPQCMGATPANRVIFGMDNMAAPRGTCTPRAHNVVQLVGPACDTSGFSADNVCANNDYSQVAPFADMLTLRQAEQLQCRRPLVQLPFSQQTTHNQLRILHDQRLLLKHRAVTNILMELQTIQENKVAFLVQGAVCQLRELERLRCSSSPRASLLLDRPPNPIGSAHPAQSVMSLPQVYTQLSAFVTSHQI